MGTSDDRKTYPPTAGDDDDVSPIEEVRLTVTNTDDPTLPVWTFRMWFLGLISCGLLASINQFFAYRTEPLIITQISLPIGHFMAAILPETKFRLPGFGSKLFSLNPGPFNMKEHVIITVFANCGVSTGGGDAYSIGAITVMKAYYRQTLNFLCALILVLTSQVYVFIY